MNKYITLTMFILHIKDQKLLRLIKTLLPLLQIQQNLFLSFKFITWYINWFVAFFIQTPSVLLKYQFIKNVIAVINCPTRSEYWALRNLLSHYNSNRFKITNSTKAIFEAQFYNTLVRLLAFGSKKISV